MFCVAFYKTSHKCGKISVLNLSAYQLIGLLPGPHEICFHLINKLTENKYLTWRLGWQRKWILNKKRKTNKQKKTVSPVAILPSIYSTIHFHCKL